MARSIAIADDDDFSQIMEKISASASADLTLVVPKGALLFDDQRYVDYLKKQTDALGKTVSVMTTDPHGKEMAAKAGFAIAGLGSASKPTIDLANFNPQPVAEAYAAQAEAAPQRFTTRTALAVFTAAIIILLLLTTVLLPQADITIYAKTMQLTRDMQVTVDTSAKQADDTQLVVPGTALNQSQKLSQQFQTSGVLDTGTQATGSVTIYNFTGKTLRLNAATTTLTAGQYVYHLTADAVNIKPTRYYSNGTDVDPSSLSPAVAVIASQPGDGYNLPQDTRLEITNSVLGSIPQKLWARDANGSISGGISNPEPQVSAADLANAKAALMAAVLSTAEEQLSSSKGLTLIDSGAQVLNPVITFDHQAGDLVSAFNGTITATVAGLAFTGSQLEKLVEARIGLTLDPNEYVVTGQGESISENYPNPYVSGISTGVLAVHYQSLVSYHLDTSHIPAEVKGKDALQVQSALLAQPDIDGIQVAFKPFWVKTVPRLSGKVYITVQLDPNQTQQ